MKSIKYKLIRAAAAIIVVFVFAATLASCGTIREDMDDCGLRLQFKYDYNMQYTDLFPAEVNRVDVFVYDAGGKFLFSRTASAPEISSESYYMDMAGLAPGTYYFVVWGGLSDDYTLANPGTETADMNRMVLNMDAGARAGCHAPLWHGFIAELRYTGGGRTETVSLIRNTNDFTVTLRKSDSSVPDLNPADVVFEIVAGDCSYDCRNLPTGTNTCSYQPLGAATLNGDGSLTTNISTMRLLNGLDARLKIHNRLTGTVIAEIDLMQYIREMYDNGAGPGMSFEEYLDREYRFEVEIIYSYVDRFLAVGIIINGWVIWFNNTEI